MKIGSGFGTSQIWGITSLELDEHKAYSKVQEETTPSGDSVSISDEAKKLYSQMIHKYDKSGANDADQTNQPELADSADAQEGAAAPQGSGGGSGLDSSNSSVEALKKQLESLKSQLMALSSQLSGSAGDSGTISKINALQSQIAALEAQINEAQAAA